jgi:hypothetical protein
MQAPTIAHWAAVKRVLRYLKYSLTYVLHIQRSLSNVLSAFTDVVWVGSADDRRSTGGYAIYHSSNLVSWSVKKQPTLSRSSTE